MNKINEKFDVYRMVTHQIIEILQTHQELNYTSTWTPTTGKIMASNPVSKNTYRGINQLYLCYVAQKEKFSQNRWITLHQGNELGATIKQGEKARPVTYWGKMYIDEKTGRNITEKVKQIIKAAGEIPNGVKLVRLLRYYNVFNIEQFENLPERLFYKGETISYTEPEKDETAEEFIINSGAKINYVRGDKNCYYPRLDFIQLCEREQFKGTEAFYKTAFHELGHWTGHATRLNREFDSVFGSTQYALEELIAELFSAFVSANCGFSSQITNNAAYIKSWLGALKDNKKFIFQASTEAQKAADFAAGLVARKIGQDTESFSMVETGEV